MADPLILVTGATGKTGGAVVAELLYQGQRPRALVHRLDARSDALRRAGAEVVAADLHDPEQLLTAMRGADRAYFCPPSDPFMIQGAVAFAVAAREARLESIVGLSQWLAAPAHPSLLTRQNWLADRLFPMLPGVAYTIVNPGYFADNYLRLINFAAHLGIFPMPVRGESRNAPPSNEDIARVAVAALRDPARHAGRTYRPTGPALLSVREMAAIIGRVLGRRVRHVNLPMPLLLRAARLQGVSAFELDGFRTYARDHDAGAFAFGAPTDDVLQVTGRPAEDFETIARRYAALPEARRSLGATLREAARFMIVPLVPGYDFAGRARDYPAPPAPRFAMDDAHWQAGHAPASLALQEMTA